MENYFSKYIEKHGKNNDNNRHKYKIHSQSTLYKNNIW